MLHSMTIRLIHFDLLEDLLRMIWGQMSISGHLGSQGSNLDFHKKCDNLLNASMLHSLTIRLTHVHQLETLYLCCGVIFNLRSFGVTGGQKVIFTENAIIRPCYTS